MAIRIAHTRLGQIFTQRCFYLFVALLVLIVVVQVVEGTAHMRLMFSALHFLVLVSAVAAVGRSKISFALAFGLALPTMAFQALAIFTGDTTQQLISWGFAAAFYVLTLGYLLRYVFREDVITVDKLHGAAAAYLMLAVLWAYGFGLAQGDVPGAFAAGGSADRVLTNVELLYFSITVLTSTGFGDIVPVSPVARALVTLEQIIGVLFVAILIARMAGIYPPSASRRSASRSKIH